MKNKLTTLYAALFLASAATTQAQTTLAGWTFDNLATGLNSSPQPSTGLGTASAVGMNNGYNNTNSISNPDIQSLAGSSSGGPNSWQIRGFNSTGNNQGNGWSTNAPIGTQGAQFASSTYGFYQIQVSFDVYATTDAEANLAVQYSSDGSHWFNANIASVASGTLATNTTSTNTVKGTYVRLTGGQWNNQITVSLSGLSGADNISSFAFRVVNASTGPDCVDTTGAVYDNMSGSWSLDNVVIQGISMDAISIWDFDLIGKKSAPYNSPAPTTGSGKTVVLGMTNNYTFSDSTPSVPDDVSIALCDVTAQAGASTGAGSFSWRVRGGTAAGGAGTPNSGWNSEAPIGTQGAEFDVDTSGYTNIILNFDIYFTTQAPDEFFVEYTTDGWATTNIASSLFYGADPAYILNNSNDPNLVVGTYFHETVGQGWYNNVLVDLTGIPAAASNPHFGFRVVNAGTGPDTINFLAQPYNNLSGNLRFDNVTVSGTSGTPAPTVTFDPHATVDHPFTNTYTDLPAWRTNIDAIYINGVILPGAAYTTTNPGKIIFTPSKSSLLETSGLLNISILSHGFGTARVAQPLLAGVATKLAVTNQLSGPSASSGTLISNPVFIVSDQYTNSTTNPYVSVTITAAVGGGGAWTLGGATQQESTNGVIEFTNLTATVNGSSSVANAYITYTVTGYGTTFNTNSPKFNIGAPPVPFTPGNLAVFQVDNAANNSTFSIIEVKPSVGGQTAPVNIVPVSATGTNALRESSAGAAGRLSLSDDGTLICFAAFADGNASTPDETFILNRAPAAMNSSNQLIFGSYTSISLGGSEGRAACVLDDDLTWITVDKGGLYQGQFGGSTINVPNLNNFNNVVVRTFGGVPYVQTQKAVFGETIPEVYTLGYDPYTGLDDVTFPNNLGTDQNAQDFYLISTNGGASYDVLYTSDQISSTSGQINKFSWVEGNWVEDGFVTNSTGVDGMFATTNGDGGVNLFYTTGGGGTPNNSVVRITDSAGWNQNINITSTNVIYTAAGNATLKGLVFVPQATANAKQLIPPPVLTAQNTAKVSSTFAITNSPADSAWHSAISSITVNGSTLPSAAYNATASGQIVFNPTQSVSLQGSGAKTIVITAAGYSTATVTQTISGITPLTLGGATLNGGNLEFAFTSTPGLTFTVLSSTNLALPTSHWQVLGTATEGPSGSYQFTDPNPATNSAVFYTVVQP